MKIGMVGYKFMGRAHAHAYRTAPYFFDIKDEVELVAVCGRHEAAVAEFAEQNGWQSYETDWRKLVERDDIDAVDIGTPNDSHYEIAMAAARAGKHILLEKPMAMSLAQAREMYHEAEKAGIKHQIGFNYRRVPAIALAKKIIEHGDIGEIFHWRAVYNQDWIVDPEYPLVWRLDKTIAGTGAIGDLASHIIDLAHFLVGPIAEVTGMAKTFIKERPLPAEMTGLSASGSPFAKSGAWVASKRRTSRSPSCVSYRSGAAGKASSTTGRPVSLAKIARSSRRHSRYCASAEPRRVTTRPSTSSTMGAASAPKDCPSS